MTVNWKRAAVPVILAAAVDGTVIPTAAVAAPTSTRTTTITLAGQEFDGFGEGRAAPIALRSARAEAKRQASAAGYDPASQCVTVFEDTSRLDPGNPSSVWIGESDLLCQH